MPSAAADSALPSIQTSGAPTQTGAPPDGTGSIVYILDSNVWLAAPDGSVPRAVTSNGTEDDPYHDPSQADDGTIFVLKGDASMHRLDRAGNDLAGEVRLPTLENGAEALAASPDGTRAAYATVGSGTLVDPRFGTPSGTFLYGGTDVANVDGTSIEGAVLPSLLFPSWIDNSHLAVSDGVDIYFDEVGPNEPETWLSLDEGCITDFDCPAGDQAAANVSTPFVSRNAHLLAYTYSPYFGDAGRRIDSITTLPPAEPEEGCLMPGQENHSDTGTFSVDGSIFVYDDTRFDPDAFETVVGQGIWAMPVDLDSPDCGASNATLIVAGGMQPDWGPAAP